MCHISLNAQISWEPFNRLGSNFVHLFFGNQQNKELQQHSLNVPKSHKLNQNFQNFDHFIQKTRMYSLLP